MSLLLLVDLDGVVYRGNDPVPGVAAVLMARANAGDDVVYVTNNSMHYRADYVRRLTDLGAPVAPDRIVSAPRATALYLQERRLTTAEWTRRTAGPAPSSWAASRPPGTSIQMVSEVLTS